MPETKTTKYQFKTGDRVRLLPTSEKYGKTNELSDGVFGTVIRADDYGRYTERDATVNVLGSTVYYKLKDLQLVPDAELSPVKYVLTYNIVNQGDPVEVFKTKAQLDAWLKGTLTNTRIVKDSIRIFECSDEFKYTVKVETLLESTRKEKK